MKRPAVFLDRDGVLTEEIGRSPKPWEVKLFDFAPDAVKLIKDKGYLTIIITNQSGVAKGNFTLEELTEFHDYIKEQTRIAFKRSQIRYSCLPVTIKKYVELW